MTKRAAIILSGGKAERFQSGKQKWQDKALVELWGKPLLVHAIESVQNHVEEMVVVINNEDRLALYSRVLANHGLKGARLVTDVTTYQLGGPLVAIFTGLKAVKADYCLTLPSDMPLLKPQVIENMFTSAENSHVVVPMWPNGRLETLLMILQRRRVTKIAETLYSLRRPRSDDIIRGALKVLFLSIVGEIRKFDLELKSFVNINDPEDLASLQPRYAEGTLTKNMRLDLGDLPVTELSCIRDAAELANEDRLNEASERFASSGANLEGKNMFFWAAVCLENQAKTLKRLAHSQTEPEQLIEQLTEAQEAFSKAARNYGLEGEMHEKNHYSFLAKRARSDRDWCEARVVELTVQKHNYGR